MKRKLITITAVISLGTILFTSVPTLADTIVVLMGKVNVTVNGKNTELTLLNYEGDLYVPLATVLDMFDGSVDWKATGEIDTQILPANNVYTLGAGVYLIGEDIPEGRYDLVVISGLGEVQHHDYVCLAEPDKINEAREVYDTTDVSQTYNNFLIARNHSNLNYTYDKFYIKGTLIVQLTRTNDIIPTPTPIAPTPTPTPIAPTPTPAPTKTP